LDRHVLAPLKTRIRQWPRVYDLAGAARLEESLGDTLARMNQESRTLTLGVGGCSPYLSGLIARAGDDFAATLAMSPESEFDNIISSAAGLSGCETAQAIMQPLRRLKARAALAAGLAEAGGVWTSMDAADALSRFADAAANSALRAALCSLKSKGFAAADAANCEARSGVAVLAMGKLGAFELNYSSDIDLIVLFDPEAPALGGPPTAREIAIAAARELVRILSEKTADGYVFRTDLRLRPDPAVTPAAISFRAAEAYYEAHGQNWERAAFIKARASAGDIAAGQAFLAALRPYIWRRHLDYAAIEDIHSIKRQIHAAKGGGEIEFFGHNIKTGRGGIREIEFLVQTQQLILGGKDPSLRERATLAALDALARAGRVGEAARETLAANYLELRRIEHRLQMIADEQTHRIPRDRAEAERLAAFLGEKSVGDFESRLIDILASTHRLFAELFEREERLSAEAGSLIFTGVENDKATLATLERLGFKRPSDVSDAIRRWHTGSLRATRTPRARELLTKLAPHLLEALSKAGDPDAAFVVFGEFLGRLPAGVQIFSLFANNPHIFNTLIRIMTISPYLGRQLSRRAHLIEALLESDWPRSPPTPAALQNELAERLRRAESYEAKLNAARRWGAERRFDAAAQLVIGAIDARRAAEQFTAIADAAIAALFNEARAETARVEGRIAGAIAVFGLGRLGAGAMTATSDVDLIFVYDAPGGAQSGGARPLDAAAYFLKLVRRFLAALSAATEEGALYEVDMKLRPSGGAGPAAVSLAAFERYYDRDAWTWEQMALIKARPIAGDPGLAHKVEAAIERVVCRSRDRAALAADAHEMRKTLADAKPPSGPFDLRQAAGGLTDLEFVLQFSTLAEAAEIGRPPQSTRELIEWLASQGRLAKDDAQGLMAASELFESVMQLGRAATGGLYAPQSAGEALRRRMSAAVGTAIGGQEEALAGRQAQVRGVYDRVVAAAARR